MKCVCLLLAFQIVFYPGAPALAKVPSTIDRLSLISIPSDVGRVRAIWRASGPSNKLVVLIEDAHCVYDAQNNIMQLLNHLHDKGNVNLVCVEGAEGPLETGVFASLKDDELRQSITEKYLKKGVLSGVEAYAIRYPEKITLPVCGVEESGLYIKNIVQFRESIRQNSDSSQFFNDAEKSVDYLKSFYYPEELRDLEIEEEKYNRGDISLKEYFRYLVEKRH